MRQLLFSVPKEYDGKRLKEFLRRDCNVSARMLIRLKQTPRGMCVNDAQAIATTVLATNDTVCLTLPEDKELHASSDTPVTIVYEDEDLLIADKPAGMPMYPVPGSDTGTLANGIAHHWNNNGQVFRFRPVYRLDKNTSGLVIVAKNSYTAAALSKNIQKEYTAVCEGIVTGSGTVDAPIGLAPGSRIKRMTGAEGVSAVTHWTSIQCIKDHTVLKLWLETGRTHQIRVHMASIGHPLAGDDLYGGRTDIISRQALHCGSISFIHPVTKQQILLESELPQDFVPFLCASDV